MRPLSDSRHQHCAGFSMIGLLLVMIVLFVLAGGYFGRGVLERQEQAVGTYQYSMDKARTVAEDANLQIVQTSVDMWVMAHPGEPCTIEKLQADGRYSIPAPPAGAKWEIDETNHVILVKSQPEAK